MAGDSASAARRAVDGLYVWLVASSLLLGLSASALGSSVSGLRTAAGLTYAALYVLLAILGALGLVVSLTLLYHVVRLLWSHSLLTFPYAGLSRLDEEGAVRLMKDTISLYRGYAPYIVIAGGLLAVAGVILAAVTASWIASGRLGLGEGLFRLAVSLIYIGYGALSLYLERRVMSGRLEAVRRAEEELSKVMG